MRWKPLRRLLLLVSFPPSLFFGPDGMWFSRHAGYFSRAHVAGLEQKYESVLQAYLGLL